MKSLFASLLILSCALTNVAHTTQQPELGIRVVGFLRVDGLLFKDLNKSGRLDVYEDWRRSVEERVNDLVTQMTVEEKAGLMVGPSLTVGPNNSTSEQPTYMVNPFNPGPPQMVAPATADGVLKRHIRQFINRDNLAPRAMVNWLNGVQQIAESSRLGVPVLFVRDFDQHAVGRRTIDGQGTLQKSH